MSCFLENWCRRTELNCRPTPYQGVALPLRYCGTSRGTPRGTAAITHGPCTRKGATLKRDAARTEKLAKALKDNLKRRKAQARARGEGEAELPSGRGLGTAPQAGLEDQPQKGPNAAKNPK